MSDIRYWILFLVLLSSMYCELGICLISTGGNDFSRLYFGTKAPVFDSNLAQNSTGTSEGQWSSINKPVLPEKLSCQEYWLLQTLADRLLHEKGVTFKVDVECSEEPESSNYLLIISSALQKQDEKGDIFPAIPEMEDFVELYLCLSDTSRCRPLQRKILHDEGSYSGDYPRKGGHIFYQESVTSLEHQERIERDRTSFTARLNSEYEIFVDQRLIEDETDHGFLHFDTPSLIDLNHLVILAGLGNVAYIDRRQGEVILFLMTSDGGLYQVKGEDMESFFRFIREYQFQKVFPEIYLSLPAGGGEKLEDWLLTHREPPFTILHRLSVLIAEGNQRERVLQWINSFPVGRQVPRKGKKRSKKPTGIKQEEPVCEATEEKPKSEPDKNTSGGARVNVMKAPAASVEEVADNLEELMKYKKLLDGFRWENVDDSLHLVMRFAYSLFIGLTKALEYKRLSRDDQKRLRQAKKMTGYSVDECIDELAPSLLRYMNRILDAYRDHNFPAADMQREKKLEAPFIYVNFVSSFIQWNFLIDNPRYRGFFSDDLIINLSSTTLRIIAALTASHFSLSKPVSINFMKGDLDEQAMLRGCMKKIKFHGSDHDAVLIFAVSIYLPFLKIMFKHRSRNLFTSEEVESQFTQLLSAFQVLVPGVTPDLSHNTYVTLHSFKLVGLNLQAFLESRPAVLTHYLQTMLDYVKKIACKVRKADSQSQLHTLDSFYRKDLDTIGTHIFPSFCVGEFSELCEQIIAIREKALEVYEKSHTREQRKVDHSIAWIEQREQQQVDKVKRKREAQLEAKRKVRVLYLERQYRQRLQAKEKASACCAGDKVEMELLVANQWQINIEAAGVALVEGEFDRTIVSIEKAILHSESNHEYLLSLLEAICIYAEIIQHYTSSVFSMRHEAMGGLAHRVMDIDSDMIEEKIKARQPAGLKETFEFIGEEKISLYTQAERAEYSRFSDDIVKTLKVWQERNLDHQFARIQELSRNVTDFFENGDERFNKTPVVTGTDFFASLGFVQDAIQEVVTRQKWLEHQIGEMCSALAAFKKINAALGIYGRSDSISEPSKETVLEKNCEEESTLWVPLFNTEALELVVEAIILRAL